MAFWKKLASLLAPSTLIQAEVEKALAIRNRRAIDDRRAQHIPRQMVLEPGGRGPRKMLGTSAEVLRLFARFNPWLRAAIDVRKREIAAARWDIVPNLECHKNELDSLRRLVLSATRYPDRATMLDQVEPAYIPSEVWRALREATNAEGIQPAEVRDRFMLAIFDLTRQAESHASSVRKLFLHPNRNRKPWDQILRAVVPDILILDAGCVELRRAKFPAGSDGLPRPTNPILELHWVDGATVRPCIDEHGQLRGIEDPTELAYEQWLENQRVPDGGWRVGDLLYIQENPQTDVRCRGYGFSRVETLIMTSMLEAMGDKEDLEELKRGTYGGFLNINDDSVIMEDVESLRAWIEEELEGTKKIPITAFQNLEYVATTPQGVGRDKKSVERRKQLALRVCAVMNMPPTKLGILEDTNRATSETQGEIADDGLRELMDLLDEQFTEGIVAEFGHDDICYRSNSAHQRDTAEDMETGKLRMELMLATPNEIRTERGDPPIENGDQPLEYLQAYYQAKGQIDGGGGQQDEGQDEQDDQDEGQDEQGDQDEMQLEKALSGFRRALAEHSAEYGHLPDIEVVLDDH